MSGFSVTERGKGVYDIKWESVPVNSAIYNKIVKRVKDVRDYGPFSGQKLKKYDGFVRGLNKQYGSTLTLDQAISLRNIILKDRIIKNYPRMNAIIGRVAYKYGKGVSILTLSQQYDFPPLNLLRGILLHNGLPSTGIYSIFADKTDPSTVLKGRDLKQFYLAEANDAESIFDQKVVAEIAAENEKIVVDYFKTAGISVTTQDELSLSQRKEFGRNVITPDILFNDEVYINGVRVYWIDYKDYAGTTVRFLFNSNEAQALKYNLKWGPGALCYHKSYVEGLVISSTMLLDARSIPVKLHNLPL